MVEQVEEKEEISSKHNDEKIEDNSSQVLDGTTNNSEKVREEKEPESKSEIETASSTTTDIDFSAINYKDFEKINQEQIDLYYTLNDNKNNIEFLNEDLVVMSKKEEEIKALKAKEKEEFDFQMEELVNTGDEIKVDLTGIIDDIEEQKNKS